MSKQDRIINLLVDLIKTLSKADYGIPLKSAEKVFEINKELKKLGLDLKERIKED